MNINSPTAIPSSQQEEMKEEKCTFWYLFLLSTQLELWRGPGGEETGTQGPLIARFTN